MKFCTKLMVLRIPLTPVTWPPPVAATAVGWFAMKFRADIDTVIPCTLSRSMVLVSASTTKIRLYSAPPEVKMCGFRSNISNFIGCIVMNCSSSINVGLRINSNNRYTGLWANTCRTNDISISLSWTFSCCSSLCLYVCISVCQHHHDLMVSHSCELDIQDSPWENLFKFGTNIHLDSWLN